MSDGLIEDAGQRRGGRGQPATRLVINRTACYAIGVNIDRDHITLVIVISPARWWRASRRTSPFRCRRMSARSIAARSTA
jgi:hypothetical protein